MTTQLPPPNIKIFPRNLTARAEYLVRGNPASSRTEASVGNTIPGLEYDERNLDKYFFPGLVFEFQRGTGTDDGLNSRVRFNRPLLRELITGGTPEKAGLKAEDVAYAGLPDDLLIHLWALRRPDGSALRFDANAFDDDLSAWRAVRDMPQGRVAIMIATIATRMDAKALDTALRAFADATVDHVQRTRTGKFAWAIFIGDSLRLLDADGVINTDIPPGELQSTMCSPWQYDFRDCKCYYWAANRPDVVAAVDGSDDFVKFMRKTLDEPTVHSIDHKEWLRLNGRSHVDIINSWEDLRIAVDDREVSYKAFLRGDVRRRFRELATIEHALAVEYLSSYYSLDTSKDRVAAAATDVFSIALDEMHHFRWVNEILAILGEAPAIGRAADYGVNFDHRKFQLAPLTEDRLAWFIQVEKPSQSLDMPGQIDGMYVRLYTTISQNRAAFSQPDELLRLVKLLIDDGETHYRLFMAVQRNLAPFMSYADFLYPINSAPPSSDISALLATSDALYGSLLAQLAAAFHLYDRANGVDLQKSVRSMQAMDAVNKQLARTGHLPKFTLPQFARAPAVDAAAVLELASGMLDEIEARLETLAATNTLRVIAEAAVSAHRLALTEMRSAMATSSKRAG
jgi:hypothetical protein